MAGHAVKHDYHLVDPSPWPFVGSVGAFLLAIGAVGFMKGLVDSDSALALMWGQGHWGGLILGFGVVIYTMIGWWGDVIKESSRGDHTPVVDIGLRYGMIMFITSEVMFFVAWFWVFFEYAIFHHVRIDPALSSWTASRC